jgi:NADPH2:quinone reductase
MAEALRDANKGNRVDVVLEMVGDRTFQQSLAALAPFGRLVHFGQAARKGAPKIDPGELMARSQGVMGFWLVHMMQRPDLMAEAMKDMFDAVLTGELEPIVGGTYPLADARKAHEAIRARRTTGKLVLTP